MSVQLNIIRLICINRQYPQIALNLTMTHEFCSIFIKNTVKQGRYLTRWLVQTKFNMSGQRVSVCRATAKGKKHFLAKR